MNDPTVRHAIEDEKDDPRGEPVWRRERGTPSMGKDRSVSSFDDRPVMVSLRARKLGELLMVVPALRALRRAFPDHVHVLGAEAQLLPLVGAIGAVDEMVAVAGGPERLGTTPLPAQCLGADLAVNLNGPGPKSHRLLLAGRPQRLWAFAHPDVPESADGPLWPPVAHDVWRWCGMLSHFGVDTDPGDLGIAVPPDPALPHGEDVTVVHPGASSVARRWPAQRFAAVARAEVAAGRRVVVTGSPPEVLEVERVVEMAGLAPSADLCGTEVRELMALVAGAGRVVCGDTSIAHLATATGTPSVVVFGPTDPARRGPPADRPWHRAIWTGRTGDPEGRSPDPGLLQVTVDDVLAALADLPENPARA
jgi:ADP-heptose:LPS heptosyltransferase